MIVCVVDIRTPEPEIEPTLPNEVIVPFTYSSRLYAGTVTPSRLSQLCFDASLMYYRDAEEVEGRQPMLLIAGEQSHSNHQATTGELLAAQIDPDQVRNQVLRNDDNRLLNTILQAEEIAAYFDISPEMLTTVAWDFHIPRIQQTYRWLGLQSRFVSVEELVDEAWQTSSDFQRGFQDRYGLRRDWPEIKEAVQQGFKVRELYTQMFASIGKGALLNWYSRTVKQGRYDDISPDGRVIRAKTY